LKARVRSIEDEVDQVLSDKLETQPAQRVASERVVLGRVVGAFGIGGWLKVQSYTDPPANILRYATWYVQLGAQTHTVKPLQGRMTVKGVQVRFEQIADRTAAELWRGAEIAVDRSDLPPPPAGQYYWSDLVGLRASSLDGEELGTIVEIRELPAHPVLVIRRPANSVSNMTDKKADKKDDRSDMWVPLVPQRLKAVDLKSGVATVDWGLDW
jgi:16S rRNA processing protein RimM